MKFSRFIVTAGQVFNMLSVIKEVEKHIQPSGQTNRVVLCKCECGNETKVRVIHLRSGRVKSCGCLLRSAGNIDRTSPLYNVWRGMRQRCKLDTYIDAHRYKKRGISICKEWDDSFIAFEKWAMQNGYKKGLYIDRSENDGNYEPSNCRFVTNIVNVNNREVTIKVAYKGETKSLQIILREKGLENHFPAIYSRLNRGWKPETAIDTPIKKGKYLRGSRTQLENIISTYGK